MAGKHLKLTRSSVLMAKFTMEAKSKFKFSESRLFPRFQVYLEINQALKFEGGDNLYYQTFVRACFRMINRPVIGRFVEKSLFRKNVFLNLNWKSKKHILIWEIRPPYAVLDYPSALLENKGALLHKRRSLFKKYFDSILFVLSK